MDNKKLLELKQERATVITSIRAIMDEHEKIEMPAEKRGEMEKAEKRFDEINKVLLEEEKQKERERSLGEAEVKPEDNLPAGEEEIRKAYVNYLVNGTPTAMEQYRALQQDDPTQAGYLVAPEKFAAQVIQDKNDLSFMRQMSNVLPPLKKASSLGYPKRTARMSTFAWGTEIEAPTADTALAFGKREFIAKPATGGILVSKTLVRNAAISIESYIRKEMAYNQNIHEEQGFLTGNGAGQPLGVFTASDDGISTDRDVSTGNTATEIKFDGLYEAKYSLKQQYQVGLNWLFSRTGVKQIAKLKDSEGQYIWQQSIVLSVPDMLMGYPVKMSENAPSTFTTGLYVGLLGNFKEGYWICDSLTMEIQALMELYALSNQVFYIGRAEVDGMPVLEECFARITLK